MPKSLCKRIVIVVQRGQRKKNRTAVRSRLGDRLGLAMATTRTKFQFTDYQMFAILAQGGTKGVTDDLIRKVMGDAYKADVHTVENFDRKVSHKYHVLKENAAKPKAPSKTALLNKALAEQVAAEFADGEPFTLNDVMAKHPADIKTFSKAGVVVNVLLAEKRVRKAAPINNKTAYVIVA